MPSLEEIRKNLRLGAPLVAAPLPKAPTGYHVPRPPDEAILARRHAAWWVGHPKWHFKFGNQRRYIHVSDLGAFVGSADPITDLIGFIHSEFGMHVVPESAEYSVLEAMATEAWEQFSFAIPKPRANPVPGGAWEYLPKSNSYAFWLDPGDDTPQYECSVAADTVYKSALGHSQRLIFKRMRITKTTKEQRKAVSMMIQQAIADWTDRAVKDGSVKLDTATWSYRPKSDEYSFTMDVESRLGGVAILRASIFATDLAELSFTGALRALLDKFNSPSFNAALVTEEQRRSLLEAIERAKKDCAEREEAEDA